MPYTFTADFTPFKKAETIDEKDTRLGDNPDTKILSSPASIQAHLKYLIDAKVITKT